MGKELTTEKISTLLRKFAVPAIVAMMANILLIFIDRLFVGRLGKMEISAVGVSYPIIMTMTAFSLLFGIGASTKISLFLGAKEEQNAEKTLANASLLLFLNSLLMLGLFFLFEEKLLHLLGSSPDTLPYVKNYGSIIILAAPFQALMFGLNQCLRSEGKPKVAMKTVMIVAATNILLDPLLMFVFKMGIKGAAIATVTSFFAGFLWTTSQYIRRKTLVAFHFKNIVPDLSIIRGILVCGASPFLMQFLIAGTNVFLNNLLKEHFGDLGVGIMTVIMAISTIPSYCLHGIVQAMQPIVGFNYGAEKYDRVKKTYYITNMWGLIIGVVAFLIIVPYPQFMIRIFVKDPEFVEKAIQGVRYSFLTIPLSGFYLITINFFQSIGKAKKTLIITFLRQLFIYPSILIFGSKFLGANLIWLAEGITSIACISFLIPLLLQEMYLIHKLEKAAMNKKEDIISPKKPFLLDMGELTFLVFEGDPAL